MGEPVLKVLQSKIPSAWIMEASIFGKYSGPLLEQFLQILSGRIGPGGTALMNLQHCMLRFRDAITVLKDIFLYFKECLSNHFPMWAS